MQSRVRRSRRLEHLEARLNLAGNAANAGDCPFVMGEGDSARAAHAVNCFASDLYSQYQQEDGNLAFSPLSISTALAMAYAGAANDTAAEMAQTMHFGNEPGLHRSFQSLLQDLDQPESYFQPELTNALWTQEGYQLVPDFLQTMDEHYSGQLFDIDYRSDPEAARQIINDWVAEQTQDRIEDHLPQDIISELTRLTLINTIYYNANWQNPFTSGSTEDRPFTDENGVTVEVPTMYEYSMYTRYATHDGFEVLELPYSEGLIQDGDVISSRGQGSMSMVILLPQDGHSVDDLSPETLVNVSDWLASDAEATNVEVFLPKFKTSTKAQLKDVLAGMGSPQMFDRFDADFTNLSTADTQLWVHDVVHDASFEIDEQGTEAAAATSVAFWGFACFAKGTPILTPDGTRLIETIEVGDTVISKDQHNAEGPIEPKPITEVFKNRAEIVNVCVGGQVIRSTERHPFFVKGKGWISAIELQTGDLVATDLSSWVAIDRVIPTGVFEDVYNFHVGDHHTYFVGEEDWGFHVWVHNGSGGCPPDPEVTFKADRPFHFILRDNETSSIVFMGRIEDPLQETNDLELTYEPQSTLKALKADANGDSVVNFSDFLILSHNYGKMEDIAFADGDFDGNGTVNFADFLILANQYRQQLT